MTIHRAIAGKPDIAPQTRARILAEIERLDWRPNIAARGLRQGKTYTLGILLSNVAASFLPEILQGIDREAEVQGYHTFVCVHEHDATRAEHHLRTLASKGVDAVIHYPTDSGREAAVLNELLASIPVVAVMREIAGFHGPSILVDDRAGGRMAADHLLRLGHRRLGFLGYGSGPFSRPRQQGFQAALESAGVTLRPEWCISDLEPGSEQILEAARSLVSMTSRPTAVFCASDRLAARVIQAAARAGYKVPRDLSVVGYNNDAWSELLPVPLTTLAQPRLEIGLRAARLVLKGELAAAPNGFLRLSPRLVERASTAPPFDGSKYIPTENLVA